MDVRKKSLAVAVTGLLLLGGGCGNHRTTDVDAFADMWRPGGGQRNEGVWIEGRVNSDDELNERIEKTCRAYVESQENSYHTPMRLDSYRHNGRVWVLTYEIETFSEQRADGSFWAVVGNTVDVWMDAYRGKVIAITRRSA